MKQHGNRYRLEVIVEDQHLLPEERFNEVDLKLALLHRMNAMGLRIVGKFHVKSLQEGSKK